MNSEAEAPVHVLVQYSTVLVQRGPVMSSHVESGMNGGPAARGASEPHTTPRAAR